MSTRTKVHFTIDKGYDIRIKGAATPEILEYQTDRVGFSLTNFNLLKSKVLVKEGDRVSIGTPVMCDKMQGKVLFVSPVAGIVEEVQRGKRRALLQLTIKIDGHDAVDFKTYSPEELKNLDRDSAIDALCERGLWPLLRQRPYNKIADLGHTPSSIFIRAMDSNPLAADPGFCLQDRNADLQAGILLLSRLAAKVFLCCEKNIPNAFKNLTGCELHTFAGPHPRSNPSLHIEKLDPINTSEKVVWTLNVQDLATIGKTLTSGKYDGQTIFAWAGPAAEDRAYYRAPRLACLDQLPRSKGETRTISGSVLHGDLVSEKGFLGYYDHSACCLLEGRERKLLGWMTPGSKALSMSRTFLTALLPQKEYDVNTSNNGDPRAIVDSEIYDRIQPLNISTAFLYKTLLAGDIEEAERLGLWSVSEEDMALASFICPSKTDFAAPLRKTLALLHKES